MTRDDCIAFARQSGIDHGWARVMNSAALVRAFVKDYEDLSDDELLDLVRRLKAHAELEEGSE